VTQLHVRHLLGGADLRVAPRTDCPFRACHVRLGAAQNDAGRQSQERARTGVVCVEDHERICADMARLTALIWWRSVCVLWRVPDRHLGNARRAVSLAAPEQRAELLGAPGG
jgi:hypothetical protein